MVGPEFSPDIILLSAGSTPITYELSTIGSLHNYGRENRREGQNIQRRVSHEENL